MPILCWLGGYRDDRIESALKCSQSDEGDNTHMGINTIRCDKAPQRCELLWRHWQHLGYRRVTEEDFTERMNLELCLEA